MKKRYKIGDKIPDGWRWAKNGQLINDLGQFVAGHSRDPKYKTESKDIKDLLGSYAGKDVRAVVKHFVAIALGKAGTKSSVGQQMAACQKIIEFYHGRPGETKTVDNNININIEHKVSELTKLITEKHQEVIDI